MILFLTNLVMANQIVNGNIEVDFPATVALGADLGAYSFSACTGTLITPRIILSAAHCGADLPPELIVQAGKAFFGPSIWEAEQIIGFQEVLIHPDYEELQSNILSTNLGANDVSLLILNEDVDVKPVLFVQEPLDESWIGRDILSVGYGITGADMNDSGTKRSAALRISSIDEMFVQSENADNDADANICSGDSGGSQLYFDDLKGEWVLLAVHSWGDQNCTSVSGSTRTDVVDDWVLQNIEVIHGSADICLINGYYDDDVCTDWDICRGVDPACIEESKKSGCQHVATSSPISWQICWQMFAILGWLSIRRQKVHLS